VLNKAFFFLLLFSCFSLAQEANLSVEGEGARVLLGQADSAIKEMAAAGFPVNRTSDVLAGARQLFDAQKSLELSGGNARYFDVIDKSEEILGLRQKAFDTNDELDALFLRIYQVKYEVNTSSLSACLGDARQEFSDERYERSTEVVDSCYTKLSKLQSDAARERAFYSSATRSITTFLNENWKLLLAASFIAVVLLLGFRRQIIRHRISVRIRHFELRRSSLKELLKKTQREYFEAGTLSEMSYQVRLKKFGELVRDIDREIPLLREEIEKTRK